MSGLAHFFRDHLQTEVGTNYSTSLLNTEKAENQTSEGSALSQYAGEGEYKTWRDSREKILQRYLRERLLDANNEFRSLQSDESPRLETQHFAQETSDSDSEVDEELQRDEEFYNKFPTPHINSAHHHAKCIRDIDLMAKSVTLKLCTAEKRWAYRQHHRFQSACNTTSHPMHLHTYMPNLLRLTLGGFQEDGPLSCAYETVLNFELNQVREDISTHRQMAENLEEDHVGAKRIHVFFYGMYAEVLNSFLSKQDARKNVWLSIQNAPHKCVIPYAASGWFDAHDLSAFCLCIADSSSIVDDQGNKINVRFDRPGMRIFIATGSQAVEHVKCLTPVKAGVIAENVDIEDSPFSDLPKQHHLTVVPESDDYVYEYKKISDLEAEYESFQSISGHDKAKCEVHLIAVVTSFTPARQIKGKDWMMNITLMDESIASLSESDVPELISMNIFGKSKEVFPDVRVAGDVIRMHRVELKTHNCKVQLTGLDKSSYVVYRCEQHGDDELEGSWVASKNTKTTETQKNKMNQLWLWGQERQRNYPSIRSEYRFTLADMRMQLDRAFSADGVRGDITVMVTSIWPVPSVDSDSLPRGFLRVWDGTGIPISDPHPLGERNEEGDPSPDALLRLADICRKVGIEPPTQVTGRVVNVAIWGEAHWEQVKDLLPGSFLRLRNTWEELKYGMNCLTAIIGGKATGTTHVTPVPDLCYEVIALLKQHDLRREEERNHESGILPLEEQGNENVDTPFPIQTAFVSNSLQGLLMSSADGTFTGPIFFRDTIPPLSSISSMDTILSRAEDGQYYYRFGLCIETESKDVANVVVSDSAGESIVAMTAQIASQRSSQALANLKSKLEDPIAWNCTLIRCAMFEGVLLLASLAER